MLMSCSSSPPTRQPDQENGKDIREEAKDALSHYSEFVAGRQAQVINSLTIVATVFLPLSFLTGYFGMDFRILTAHAEITLWQFILLGDQAEDQAGFRRCWSPGWARQ
jgi:CorA-like Mg2+ transporter protein